MTPRERALTVLLGITGVVAAAAIALAANAVSGREIGLSSEPVSLAAGPAPPKPAPAREIEDRADDHGSDHEAELSDDSGSGSGEDGPDDSDRSGSSGSGSSSGPSGSSGSSGSGSGDDHGGRSGED